MDLDNTDDVRVVPSRWKTRCNVLDIDVIAVEYESARSRSLMKPLQ